MGIPSLLMTVFCLLYEKMLNAGMGNKFEFDKEIIMIPISDILIRSISGYVFMAVSYTHLTLPTICSV